MLQKIFGILLLLSFGSAFGDYLEVNRSATIKASPESGATIYERPAVGTARTQPNSAVVDKRQE